MDISTIRNIQLYLSTKSDIPKLESQIRKLQAQLSKLAAEEVELSAKFDMSVLITSLAIKHINSLLESNRPLWLVAHGGQFPVSYANLKLDGDKVHVSIIFSQRIFNGWKTEKPNLSYQSLPWSLETPQPPSEFHIPEYFQVIDYAVPVICWEQGAQDVCLWQDESRCVLFRWGEQDSKLGNESSGGVE